MITWEELKNHINKMDKKQISNQVFILDCNIGYFCEVSLTFQEEGSFDGIDEGDPFLSLDR